MAFDLVVVRPFAGHEIGTVISDPAAIGAVLAGEHAMDVVRVATGTVPAGSVAAGSN